MLARRDPADGGPGGTFERLDASEMSPFNKRSEMVLGVVLAGGQSKRMGADKALIELDGVTLAERAGRRLAAICSRVVVADGGRRALDGMQSVADGPGQGPVAGILGAAAAFPDAALLLLACDLPRVPNSLLGELVAPTSYDWRVPRWQGQLEPLCALYRPAALAALRRQVDSGVFAPHRLAELGALTRGGLNIDYLDDDQLRRHGDPTVMFTNLNRPEDLALLKGSRNHDRS